MSKDYNESDSLGGSDFFHLNTQRLLLRSFLPEDLDSFYQYRQDPELYRYQDWETFTLQEAEDFVIDQSKKSINDTEEWIQLAVVLAETKELIGDCAIRRYDHQGALAEIGYTITSAHQGNGFAYEAVSALIKLLFDKYHTHRITARVDPRNTGSISLLKKLKFTEEGCVRECYFDNSDQKWVDELIFGLLSREAL